MIFIDQNYNVYYQDGTIGSVDRKSQPYQIFVYKKLEDSAVEIHVDKDPYQPDQEGYEFLGSVVVPSDTALDLEEKKRQLFDHLYSKVDSIHKVLLSNYSSLEVESWQQQEEEAKALLAVKTPVIDALCAVRGCSRDALALKIVANAEVAKGFGVNILAWQQGFEQKIKNMESSNFPEFWKEISEKGL